MDSTAELKFYEAVTRLDKAAKQAPVQQEVHYSIYKAQLKDRNAGQYVLSLAEELQLADHIALLCHDDKGRDRISAVFVVQQEGGISVVVASNKGVPPQTRSHLDKLLNIYSRGGPGLTDRLFEVVLEWSTPRINQRIRNDKVLGRPQGRSLAERLTDLADLIEKCNVFPQECVPMLRSLSTAIDGYLRAQSPAQARTLLREMIVECGKLAYRAGNTSFEKQQKRLSKVNARIKSIVHDVESATTAVREVDKLATYRRLCDELCRLRREKPASRDLLSNIRARYVEPPGLTHPEGSAVASCYMHAEMQLILDYERAPANPPPRAMGCSKLACLLCDLTIRNLDHGFYIRGSHRALYAQWAFPTASWMLPSRATHLQEVQDRMTQELEQIRMQFLNRKTPLKIYLGQSKACLTLYPDFNASAASLVSPPQSVVFGPGTSDKAPMASMAKVTEVTEASRTEQDLPLEAEVVIELPAEAEENPAAAEAEGVAFAEQIKIINRTDVLSALALGDNNLASSSDSAASSTITLTSEDLELNDAEVSRHVNMGTPNLYLQIDEHSLHFEFSRLFAGLLKVRRLRSSSPVGDPRMWTAGAGEVIDAHQLPDQGHVKRVCLDELDALRFILRLAEVEVEVALTWADGSRSG
jgi:hypothetical protein